MAIKLNNFEIGANKLTILAGPCAAESMDILRTTAEGLKKVCEELDINYVFKSSFDNFVQRTGAGKGTGNACKN